ncbi:tripartite tricarboxylate transporter substrate binding protein [Reyranella sp. CPCC 100927]|uniref:Bug family tripartite tricarboxylate transporter substrate binding protein n=1 Tax=Reyranella sp. CPCC 100927 TaxID=2599616 RepID=UPI0011B45F1A|nr:tripartite tricarboxylate transporter substrate-binding protein [Reyranella sp. CPCC 100927]TWT15005.1 tripartite tricarboxylate transporter substrate binding protein [Reyranella sp. CPCC 100927]
MRLSRRAFVAAASTVLAASAATIRMSHAQAWPSRPLRLVIPFPAGGAQDNVGRVVAAKLSERLGQQVVPDNRPGASGILAADIVAKAPADGYTVLLGNIASHTINPHLQKLPYDPFGDFIAVAATGSQPNLLCAHPAFPHDTVAKLVAAAKAAPGKINYGSSGTSTSPSLSMALFKLRAGIDLTLAAYKGAAPAANDAVAGHIPLVASNFDSLRALVQVGKLKAIATTGAARSPALPDVPTFAEQGFPDVVVTAWTMLFVPTGTPREAVERLRAETVASVAAADLRARFAEMGVEPMDMTEAQLVPYVRAEYERWGEVIRAAGLKPD